MWTWSLALTGFNSESTTSQQQWLWKFAFAPMFIHLQKWLTSIWACISRQGCSLCHLLGLKWQKSACFWLFVNEITMLTVWNHLVQAPRGLFASNPTWHPSEVRILLWLRCLQEVLRATKNLAKIIHKSIMNAKALPTIERLPDKPGPFLWEPGYTWRNHPEAKAEREGLLSFSWLGLFSFL